MFIWCVVVARKSSRNAFIEYQYTLGEGPPAAPLSSLQNTSMIARRNMAESGANKTPRKLIIVGELRILRCPECKVFFYIRDSLLRGSEAQLSWVLWCFN